MVGIKIKKIKKRLDILRRLKKKVSVCLGSGSLLPQMVPKRSNPGHQLLGASGLLL